MDPVYSVTSADLHYIFLGIEYLALIVFVGVLTQVCVARPNLLKGIYKKVIIVAAVLFAIGMTGAYAANLYNYLHYVRPAYERINSQIQHDKNGL